MDRDPIEIGKRIRSIREKRGMTSEQFAEMLTPPASKGTVSKWENGRYIPNNKRLVTIADLGGISVEDLLYGTLSEEFEAAETVLNDLINEDNKHFFEVNEETKKRLISIAVERNKSLFLNKNRNDINLNTLRNYLESTFEEYYYENVIGDSSAIMLMLGELESLKYKIGDYYKKDGIYPLWGSLNLELVLEEDNLNQELGKELFNDLNELTEKYNSLIEKLEDRQIRNKLQIKLFNSRTDMSDDEILGEYLETIGESNFKDEIIQTISSFLLDRKGDKEVNELIERYSKDIGNFLDSKPFKVI